MSIDSGRDDKRASVAFVQFDQWSERLKTLAVLADLEDLPSSARDKCSREVDEIEVLLAKLLPQRGLSEPDLLRFQSGQDRVRHHLSEVRRQLQRTFW